jgi:hypothetical protein
MSDRKRAATTSGDTVPDDDSDDDRAKKPKQNPDATLDDDKDETNDDDDMAVFNIIPFQEKDRFVENAKKVLKQFPSTAMTVSIFFKGNLGGTESESTVNLTRGYCEEDLYTWAVISRRGGSSNDTFLAERYGHDSTPCSNFGVETDSQALTEWLMLDGRQYKAQDKLEGLNLYLRLWPFDIRDVPWEKDIDVLADIGCLEGPWILFPQNDNFRTTLKEIIEDIWANLIESSGSPVEDSESDVSDEDSESD